MSELSTNIALTIMRAYAPSLPPVTASFARVQYAHALWHASALHACCANGDENMFSRRATPDDESSATTLAVVEDSVALSNDDVPLARCVVILGI